MTSTCISTRPDETSKLSKLKECVKILKDWMTNNFLLLNSDKTEILLNSTQNLLDHNSQLDRCIVTSSTVKNLGVILNSNLSFENNISHAFFHLWKHCQATEHVTRFRCRKTNSCIHHCDEWGGTESRGNGARPVELMIMNDTCATHRSQVPRRSFGRFK